jgi:hypothetical protein
VQGRALPDHFAYQGSKLIHPMKYPAMNKQQQSNAFITWHPPVAAHPLERILLLVRAAITSHGGIYNMNLDDWREVEHRIRQRLDNEE